MRMTVLGGNGEFPKQA